MDRFVAASARLALALLTALAVLAAPAHAAGSRLVIRGAGFGHGVGMSQYGALGFAQHGWAYPAILAHYYKGTALTTLAEPETVRVLLKSGAALKFTGATAVGTTPLNPEAVYTVVPSGLNALTIKDAGGAAVATGAPPLSVTTTGAPMVLRGRADNGVTDGAYRGAFEFRMTALGTVRAIDAVDLEDYVRGVVGGEVSPSWPAPALQAQAVAARTYAITTGASTQARDGFAQYADTRSQLYSGVKTESKATDAAVALTAGQVVTYAGQPAVTYFFSTSGGRTENVENGFPGAKPEPWLVSVKDPYDNVSPLHAWGPIEMPLTTVTKRLGNLVRGQFRHIRVLKRGVSSRVIRAEVIGTAGTVRVTGDQLAARLGLRSDWMTFRVLNAAGKVVKAPKGDVGGTTPTTTATTTTPTTVSTQGAATFGDPVTTTVPPASTTTTVPAPGAGGGAGAPDGSGGAGAPG